MKTNKLESDFQENLISPLLRINQGEMIRIETVSIDRAYGIYDRLLKLNFGKVISGKTIPGKSLFYNPSVKHFLSKKELSQNQILSFCERTGIDTNDRLFKLTEGQRNTVILFGLSDVKETLIVSTIGMYLSCLEESYEKIKKILDNGGSCIEITYPPFGGDKLDKVISPKLQEISKSEDRLSKRIGSGLTVIQY